nr:transmembrane protein 131 [Onthophagus taurus]
MPKLHASWPLFILTLLGLVARTRLTIYDGGHAFIPSSHDRYIMQDISSMHEELSSDISSTFNNLKLNLRFEPEFLDFKQRPLGVPHVEKVRLINVDRNRSVDMTSISGSTVHFHSSFFENKKIPPMGNTTFNVVFLGREEGSIESSLYIHTTEGHLKYRVKGASTYSPYRLRPIVGIKLPINTSFAPLIYMHNPHTEPVQIVEVYSSGGDFHLELPSGELEGPKDLWEIPPLETKAIIRVSFHARSEQNHTAYVRIKLNNTDEILVVPLEVEVTSSASFFHPQGSVDFGIGGSLDPAKKLKLVLQNPLRKPMKIHSITTTSKAIKIDYDRTKLSDAKMTTDDLLEVGMLTLDWKTAFDTKDFSGQIVIKYKNSKTKTKIPYYITIVEGGLSFNTSITKYFVREKITNLSVRKMEIRNEFPTPVRLTDVVLPKEAQTYFQILDFKSIVLQPKEEKVVFKLVLKSNVSLAEVNLNSHILLRTNVSDVEIPLLTYDGQLERYLSFRSKDNSLDLGLISIESTKETYILLLNKNPVSVVIKHLSTSLPSSTINVVGCDRGDPMDALLKENFRNSSKCVRLRSNEYTILRLTVHTSTIEGQIWGDVSVQTQYEKMSVPVHFKVAQGKLDIEPDVLIFDQCFPGKICTRPLRVHSTFNDPMVIEDILTIPPDPRITSKHSGHIMGKATKVIGHLFLDPNIECHPDCYLGIQKENTDEWLRTFSLPKSSAEFDINLVNTFYNRYLNFSSNKHHRWQNITMRLDTSEVKGHVFHSRVHMTWPSLISNSETPTRSICQFPLTQVGNISYQNLTITNPSTLNLIIQLVMDNVYPNAESLKDALSFDFFLGASSTIKRNKAFFFAENYSEMRESFIKTSNTIVNRHTVPILLKPGENFTVKVGYVATDAISDSSFLFIRNNLTVIEVVHLKAQGAYPSFKFGNRKPGALQPLLFELNEKHLKDCEKDIKSKRFISTNLSIKRTFTARNTGDIVVFINNFLINGLSCEGYGFKVLNCEPFALKPNSTKKIDIEFTPDFTLLKITRQLTLETSLNQNVNYTLVATVPQIYLNLCPKIVPRPSWEVYIYNSSILSMIAMLICVCVAALIESERILKSALNVISRHNPNQGTLDLRLIGAQTKAEIRNPKLELDDQKDAKRDKVVSEKNKDESKMAVEEKYTVLIPTTGKSKKKLAKTKSNDILNDITDNKNKESVTKDKIVEKIAKKNEIKMTRELRKLKEKKVNNNYNKEKKFLEPTVQTCEEETSSTTTESSCNNEEIEKPPPNKILLVRKHSKNGTKHDEELHQKIFDKKKLIQKQSTNKKEFKENIIELQKERKEKIFKKPSEKMNNFKLDNSTNIINNSRVSPSVNGNHTNNVWGENKASFSDVVSRNETQTFSTLNSPTLVQSSPTNPKLQPSKPTVYVEPYNKTNQNVELGPIGSRKDYFNGSPTSNLLLQESQIHHQINNQINQINQLQPNNSFFSDMDVNYYSSLDLQYGTGIQDPWLRPGDNGVNGNGVGSAYWDSILNGGNVGRVEGGEMMGMGVDSVAVASSSSSTSSSAAMLQESCWSWGSPVWQPLGTDLCRGPTRTPPGFAPQRDDERTSQTQQNNSQIRQQQVPENIYGPFSVNIWSHQQQANPWTFPHSQ